MTDSAFITRPIGSNAFQIVPLLESQILGQVLAVFVRLHYDVTGHDHLF